MAWGPWFCLCCEGAQESSSTRHLRFVDATPEWMALAEAFGQTVDRVDETCIGIMVCSSCIGLFRQPVAAASTTIDDGDHKKADAEPDPPETFSWTTSDDERHGLDGSSAFLEPVPPTKSPWIVLDDARHEEEGESPLLHNL